MVAKKGRLGGSATLGKRNHIQENDIYFHPIVSDALIKALSVHISKDFVVDSLISKNKFRVLDACCGAGALGTSFKKHFKTSIVDFIDVKPREGLKRFKQTNIAYWTPSYKYDVILCNPPWIPVELSFEIYYKLLELLDPCGVLFFIINNTFCYQGPKRARRLKFQKYYLLPRFVFRSSNRELLDCGTMVYHNDGKLPLEAISRDCFIDLPKLNRCDSDDKLKVEEVNQSSLLKYLK